MSKKPASECDFWNRDGVQLAHGYSFYSINIIEHPLCDRPWAGLTKGMSPSLPSKHSQGCGAVIERMDSGDTRWGGQFCPVLRASQIRLSMQETQETRIRCLGREDPLEEETATHSSILAWEIPWTEEPGKPHSMSSQRVRHNWACTHVRYSNLGDFQRKSRADSSRPVRLTSWSA